MTMYIKGLGLCTPGKPVSNTALAQRFALNEEWISLYLGNQSRYFATDLNSGVQHYSLMDIARQAAIAAIDNAQIDKSKIDFIILATATPDKLMPATVNEVAHDLEMFNIPTYQLQSGCCGAMQALNLANDLLSVGRYRYGLVIGADICNKFIDPLKDYSDSLASEIINFALFGADRQRRRKPARHHPFAVSDDRIYPARRANRQLARQPHHRAGDAARRLQEH
jgi:3-oxoacyl-[acyl-carrier-protein] synthase-3